MRNFNFTFTILISEQSQLWVTTWGLAEESIMHVLKSTENRIHYHYLLKLSRLRRTGWQRENKPSFHSMCTSSSWCVKQKWRCWYTVYRYLTGMFIWTLYVMCFTWIGENLGSLSKTKLWSFYNREHIHFFFNMASTVWEPGVYSACEVSVLCNCHRLWDVSPKTYVMSAFQCCSFDGA